MDNVQVWRANLKKQHNGDKAVVETAFQANAGDDLQSVATAIQDLRQQIAALQSSRTSGGSGSSKGPRLFRGTCYACHKPGHRRNECPTLKSKGAVATPAVARDSKSHAGDMDMVDFPACAQDESVPSVYSSGLQLPDLIRGIVETWMWLVDSGANYHMTSVEEDLVSYTRLERRRVKGVCAWAVGQGDVRAMMISDDRREEFPVVLHDVLHVPELAARAGTSHHRLLSVQRQECVATLE